MSAGDGTAIVRKRLNVPAQRVAGCSPVNVRHERGGTAAMSETETRIELESQETAGHGAL